MLPVTRSPGRGRAIDLRDEWRTMPPKKAIDSRQCRQECLRKFRKRCFAKYHQKGDVVPNNSVPLIQLVANAGIMRERHPTTSTDLREPHFIRSIMREMIGVPLDVQTAGPQNRAKLFAKIAI